jgi:subtilisin family serine protease
VGASTDTDFRADYSQYGPGLDFLAPSDGGRGFIVTTDRTGRAGYSSGDADAYFGGTSASCPQAAGVGALVLSVNPELTAQELRQLLRGACDPVGTMDAAHAADPEYGHGRLNAHRALLLAAPPRILTQAPGPDAVSLRVKALPGQVLELQASADLIHWETVHRQTMAVEESTIHVAAVPGQGMRFHRVFVAGAVLE